MVREGRPDWNALRDTAGVQAAEPAVQSGGSLALQGLRSSQAVRVPPAGASAPCRPAAPRLCLPPTGSDGTSRFACLDILFATGRSSLILLYGALRFRECMGRIEDRSLPERNRASPRSLGTEGIFEAIRREGEDQTLALFRSGVRGQAATAIRPRSSRAAIRVPRGR